MYTMVQIIKPAPGIEEKLQKFISTAPERYAKQKGFRSVVFFKSEKRNEYGSISVWETKEDYDAHYNAYSSEDIRFLQNSIGKINVQGGYRVIDEASVM